jgi:subtilisin family serine protease
MNRISTASLTALSLFLAAGLCATALAQGTPASTQSPPAKKQVKTAADLPIRTYTIQGKASEFMLSGEPLSQLAAKLRADLESDLATLDIQDKSTLQSYYSALQAIAVHEGRYDDALSYVEKSRAIETKESKKLMSGQLLRAIVAAKEVSGADRTAVIAALLKADVSKLPWDVIREEVISAKGRADIMSRELVLGQMKGQLDPIVEASKGELSGELARGLVSARVLLDVLLPAQPALAQAYGELIAANTREMTDTWTPTLVTLSSDQKATPVVIGIWDSGVDVKPFGPHLYVNTKEQVNGKDDDGNGYVDDVNGIATDLESKRTAEILHGVTELKNPLTLVESHTKGLMDLQANIQSAEADALKKHLSSLKAEQVNTFLEDLNLYGNYSHGTHVAGIAAEGNPFARILPARLTFDYRSIPLLTPSEELSKRTAQSYKDTVAYFKATGVRVVNMSWGLDYKSIEGTLEAKGAGGTAQERSDFAKRLFAIERDGLEAALKSAPEILFVAAAGNSDNDNQFSQTIPSGFTLPNLLTVGAVDSSGKPTGFTTFGKNVRLYANGFEVESYVPGGKRIKYSGTSMAAPNAANLAAKILALNPKLTPADVSALIAKHATPMEGRSELSVINPKATLTAVRVP